MARALARAAEVQPALNCFTAIWHDEAMRAADEAAAAVARGDALGVLHGVPVAVKDTTPVAGHRTTFGSYAFEHWVPDRDAYVVTALRRAGAIIIGQTTSPEFAHTLVTDSPLWGTTRNPHALDRTPGGSSGGSGAAVASGCVPLAEGSDMGGSVRIPAAWSGVVGLKPGLGRIPMDVLPGLFDSISHHGPLARCADDARLFLAATQGPDDADIMSIPGPLDLSRPLDGDLDRHAPRAVDDARLLGGRPGDRRRRRGRRRTGSRPPAPTVDPRRPRVPPGATGGLGDAVGRVHGGLLRRPAREFGDRMDPEVVAPDRDRPTGSAPDYKRSSSSAPTCGSACARAAATTRCCARRWRSRVPGRQGRLPPPAAVHRRLRAADMTAVFNMVSPCPASRCRAGATPSRRRRAADRAAVVGRRWREDTVLRIARAG